MHSTDQAARASLLLGSKRPLSAISRRPGKSLYSANQLMFSHLRILFGHMTLSISKQTSDLE